MAASEEYAHNPLIETYIGPRLVSEECRRLRIPKDFVKGVYGFYSVENLEGLLVVMWKKSRMKKAIYQALE